jgi:hypothetical protein
MILVGYPALHLHRKTCHQLNASISNCERTLSPVDFLSPTVTGFTAGFATLGAGAGAPNDSAGLAASRAFVSGAWPGGAAENVAKAGGGAWAVEGANEKGLSAETAGRIGADVACERAGNKGGGGPTGGNPTAGNAGADAGFASSFAAVGALETGS